MRDGDRLVVTCPPLSLCVTCDDGAGSSGLSHESVVQLTVEKGSDVARSIQGEDGSGSRVVRRSAHCVVLKDVWIILVPAATDRVERKERRVRRDPCHLIGGGVGNQSRGLVSTLSCVVRHLIVCMLPGSECMMLRWMGLPIVQRYSDAPSITLFSPVIIHVIDLGVDGIDLGVSGGKFPVTRLVIRIGREERFGGRGDQRPDCGGDEWWRHL